MHSPPKGLSLQLGQLFLPRSLITNHFTSIYRRSFKKKQAPQSLQFFMPSKAALAYTLLMGGNNAAHLSVRLPFHPSQSMHWYVNMTVVLFICLGTVALYTYLSVCQSDCSPVCVSPKFPSSILWKQWSRPLGPSTSEMKFSDTSTCSVR